MIDVYEHNGLRVRAFGVDHAPVEPAVGYRIDYRGRSVVISGDTRVVRSVERAAQGVDILVHEALNRALMERIVGVMEGVGLEQRAEHTRHVIPYHADTLELAKLAEAAEVDHLVLTHLIPPVPDNFLLRRLFTRGMSDHYGGRITVGRDGLELSLAPVRGERDE